MQRAWAEHRKPCLGEERSGRALRSAATWPRVGPHGRGGLPPRLSPGASVRTHRMDAKALVLEQFL